MLYKLLWDTVVREDFPATRFFNFFALNRHEVLSQDVRDNIADAGIPAQVYLSLTPVTLHSMLSIVLVCGHMNRNSLT